MATFAGGKYPGVIFGYEYATLLTAGVYLRMNVSKVFQISKKIFAFVLVFVKKKIEQIELHVES